MTEATTGANKAKTAKHTASPFGMPNYEMLKFELPKIEMPEAFREMAEKGVVQAKDNYEKIQAAAEEATDLLKSTYATAAKGTADYNRKVIEIAGTNAHAALDYAYELLGVKSPSEFIELSTAHARKQFEAMTAQTKELTELAPQKVTTEIAARDNASRAAELGGMALENDDMARGFGANVIRDLIREAPSQHAGWILEIARGNRVVAAIPFGD